MKDQQKIKEVVKEKYSKIAEQDRLDNLASCCGAGTVSEEAMSIMADDYSQLEGYNPDADLGLGCGLPTQFAGINKGDTVIDLGSGAGNDCFIARHETGETGKVIGIDFSETMITKARNNALSLGYNNIEFRYGDIEEMPALDNEADVIVSNCVLNLVPNKEKVITEIFRVLKPGGHFSISDVVLSGDLPHQLKEDAEMYVGCVSGAIQKDEYLGYIEKLGFKDITLFKEKEIVLPDDVLAVYMSKEEIEEFRNSPSGIYSITVFANKPGKKGAALKPKIRLSELGDCDPQSGCC